MILEIQANAIRQDKKRCIITQKEEMKVFTDDMIMQHIERIKIVNNNNKAGTIMQLQQDCKMQIQ